MPAVDTRPAIDTVQRSEIQQNKGAEPESALPFALPESAYRYMSEQMKFDRVPDPAKLRWEGARKAALIPVAPIVGGLLGCTSHSQ